MIDGLEDQQGALEGRPRRRRRLLGRSWRKTACPKSRSGCALRQSWNQHDGNRAPPAAAAVDGASSGEAATASGGVAAAVDDVASVEIGDVVVESSVVCVVDHVRRSVFVHEKEKNRLQRNWAAPLHERRCWPRPPRARWLHEDARSGPVAEGRCRHRCRIGSPVTPKKESVGKAAAVVD